MNVETFVRRIVQRKGNIYYADLPNGLVVASNNMRQLVKEYTEELGDQLDDTNVESRENKRNLLRMMREVKRGCNKSLGSGT